LAGTRTELLVFLVGGLAEFASDRDRLAKFLSINQHCEGQAHDPLAIATLTLEFEASSELAVTSREEHLVERIRRM